MRTTTRRQFVRPDAGVFGHLDFHRNVRPVGCIDKIDLHPIGCVVPTDSSKTKLAGQIPKNQSVFQLPGLPHLLSCTNISRIEFDRYIDILLLAFRIDTHDLLVVFAPQQSHLAIVHTLDRQHGVAWPLSVGQHHVAIEPGSPEIRFEHAIPDRSEPNHRGQQQDHVSNESSRIEGAAELDLLSHLAALLDRGINHRLRIALLLVVASARKLGRAND